MSNLPVFYKMYAISSQSSLSYNHLLPYNGKLSYTELLNHLIISINQTSMPHLWNKQAFIFMSLFLILTVHNYLTTRPNISGSSLKNLIITQRSCKILICKKIGHYILPTDNNSFNNYKTDYHSQLEILKSWKFIFSSH